VYLEDLADIDRSAFDPGKSGGGNNSSGDVITANDLTKSGGGDYDVPEPGMLGQLASSEQLPENSWGLRQLRTFIQQGCEAIKPDISHFAITTGIRMQKV
jgi:hypothetical protein